MRIIRKSKRFGSIPKRESATLLPPECGMDNKKTGKPGLAMSLEPKAVSEGIDNDIL